MGASCAKDKSATAKVDRRDGAARQNDAARRTPQPATGAAKPKRNAEKELVQCGVKPIAANNNNNGKPAGGGISAYKPAEDVAKAYFEYINELRNVAVATGVMPVVEGSAEVDSTRNNDGSCVEEARAVPDPRVVACPPQATLTVYQCQPLAGDTVVAKGMYSSVHLARLSVLVGTPEAQMNATVPRHPVRRRTSGGSSIVFSSDPASPNDMDSASLSFTSGAMGDSGPPSPQLDASKAAHYIIAMKEVPMYSSYAATVMLESVRTEVRNWTRLSAYCPRVLRCYTLEYVYGDRVSLAVAEASCQHFSGLAKDEGATLKATTTTTATPSGSPLGKLLERKRSFSGGGGSGSPASVFGSLSKGRGGSASEAALVDTSGTPQKLRVYLEYAKYGTLRGYQTKEMPERFNKTRLHELTARAYMRDVLLALLQVHEVGELQYDLCAKSIYLNRPVQLAYGTYFPAYISDVPTGDLASVTPTQLGKAIGLLDPPLPPASSPSDTKNINNSANRNGAAVGRPPNNLNHHNNASSNNNNAVGANVHGSPNKRVSGEPFATSNEPINGAAGVVGNKGQAGGEAKPLQMDLSVLTQHASGVPQVSNSDGHYNNNNNNNNQRNINGDGGEDVRLGSYERHADMASPLEVFKGSPNEYQRVTPSQSHVTSPLRREAAERGSPKKSVSGSTSGGNFRKHTSVGSMRPANYVDGDDAVEHKRLNEIYRRYMDDYDFRRGEADEVPFPSPHDGVTGQTDADLLASTMLPEESWPTPSMHVTALQRSSLGGVVIISPDHHTVKPHDPVRGPDLRGRLPMVITPSTDMNALICGSPHTTAPTFTPTRAAAPLPLPPQHTASSSLSQQPAGLPLTHTMSAGTMMADAAGALGRARGGAPLTKLNHSSLLRRAMAYGDADKIEDIPVHKYVTVTHAAPEVLHRRTFSAASDIYAFAMTFIELVTDDGNIMAECLPAGRPKPKTRREKDEYDTLLTANLDKWYQTRLAALRQHYDAVAKEQELPATVSPRAGPTVVRIPEHLSDEARNVLRWCLQGDPQKRPTAAELLRSRYFMLGDWIAAPAVVAAERPTTKQPEKPWDTSISFDAAARAAGLPSLL